MQTLSKLLHQVQRALQKRVTVLWAMVAILGGGWMAPSAIAAEFAVAADANLTNGAVIFEANCAGCHANGGNVIRRGKNLKARALRWHHVDSIEAVSAIIIQGKGIMSAYGDRLSDDDVRDVASYVLDRANTNWK